MEILKEQKLSFPAVSENITLVEKLIDEICSLYNISEDHYGNILVALTEAVNNAIYHGSKGDPEKMVEVLVESSEKEIKFEVHDDGEGFDFKNIPDPTSLENIEKPNGRGVFLMRHLADFIEFKDKGRTVLLKFKLFSN